MLNLSIDQTTSKRPGGFSHLRTVVLKTNKSKSFAGFLAKIGYQASKYDDIDNMLVMHNGGSRVVLKNTQEEGAPKTSIAALGLTPKRANEKYCLDIISRLVGQKELELVNHPFDTSPNAQAYRIPESQFTFFIDKFQLSAKESIPSQTISSSEIAFFNALEKLPPEYILNGLNRSLTTRGISTKTSAVDHVALFVSAAQAQKIGNLLQKLDLQIKKSYSLPNLEVIPFEHKGARINLITPTTAEAQLLIENGKDPYSHIGFSADPLSGIREIFNQEMILTMGGPLSQDTKSNSYYDGLIKKYPFAESFVHILKEYGIGFDAKLNAHNEVLGVALQSFLNTQGDLGMLVELIRRIGDFDFQPGGGQGASQSIDTNYNLFEKQS